MDAATRVPNPKKLLQLLLAAVFVKLTLPAFSSVINLGATGDQLTWLAVVAVAVYAKRALTATRDISALHTSVSRLSVFMLIFALAASFLNGLGGFFTGLFGAGMSPIESTFTDTYVPMILAAIALIAGIYFGFLGKKASASDE